MSKNHIESSEQGGGKSELLCSNNYVPVVMQHVNNVDEVSLFDLWLVLVRRKWIILLVMSASLLVALVYTIYKPDVYRYFASLEIGVMSDKGQQIFLEQPQSVLAKLQKSYIPEVLREHGRDGENYEITASLDKGTHVITLEGRSAEDDAAIYQEMITKIINKTYIDHQRISRLYKKEIDLEKSRTQNQLAHLKDEKNLLLSQKKRIEEKAQLLRQRIVDTKRSLENAENTRQLAAKNVTTEGKALALLMMDNDIRSRMDHLAGLEKELIVEINNEREVITNQIQDNQRQQAEMLDQLDKFDIQQSLFETRALTAPMQSFKPVGISKKLILAVTLFGGLFLGIFAAFFIEFLNKARNYQEGATPASDV